MTNIDVLHQPTTGKKRLDWIDALRALAIILVVFGHQVSENTLYFVLTSPIKMPLFFLISGFVFKDKGGDTREIIKYLVFRLLLPWMFLSLIWLRGPIWIIRGEGTRVLEYLFKMFSGEVSWYMTCYIVASTVLFLVYKFVKNEKARIGILLSLGFIGFALKYVEIGEFAELNNALLVQFYLAMGILLKKNLQRVLSLPIWTVFGSVGIYGVLAVVTCMCYPGSSIDVNSGEYYNYAVSLTMIVVGCYALVRAVESLTKVITIPKFFVEIGKNTLVIYLLHSSIISCFAYGLKLLHISSSGGLLWAIIYTIVAVAAGTIIGVLLNRFCPVLIGNMKFQTKSKKA